MQIEGDDGLFSLLRLGSALINSTSNLSMAEYLLVRGSRKHHHNWQSMAFRLGEFSNDLLAINPIQTQPHSINCERVSDAAIEARVCSQIALIAGLGS